MLFVIKRPFYANLFLLMALSFLVGFFVFSLIVSYSPPVENKEEASQNAVIFILELLFVTFLIFLAIKKGFLIIFKFFLFIALFFSMALFLSIFVGDLLSFFLSFILTLVFFMTNNEIYRNIFMVVVSGVASAVIASFLGFFFSLWVLFLLSVYDVIAVFFTKHMVVLAKPFVDLKEKKNIKEMNVLHLGGGDIIMPLVVSLASYLHFGPFFSLSILLLSFIGLVLTFNILEDNPGMVLPALPLQGFLIILFSFVFFVVKLFV